MQNIVTLGLMARYREISKVFPISSNVKLVTPVVGSNLNPGPLFEVFEVIKLFHEILKKTMAGTFL